VSTDQLTRELAVIRRQLALLDLQARKVPRDASIEELQSRASELGLKLLNIAQYGVNRLAPTLATSLLAAGHQLHISETERVYLDGGASIARIIDSIRNAIEHFNAATQAVLPTKD
jgi:hypothetical protein